MTESNIIIKVATSEDLDGIIKLQKENQIAQGGSLSAELSYTQIKEMMSDMPQIVALADNQIVGFLLTTSQSVNKKRNVAIVDAMFASFKGNKDSYIYGPICVSNSQRGKGLAQLLFKELLNKKPNKEGILFIKSDNEASLKAHKKMGMYKVSSFCFNNSDFDVFAY